jgi:elongation factor P hydroxylase
MLLLNLVSFAVLDFLHFSKAFLALHNIAFWCADSKRKRRLSLLAFSADFP